MRRRSQAEPRQEIALRSLAAEKDGTTDAARTWLWRLDDRSIRHPGMLGRRRLELRIVSANQLPRRTRSASFGEPIAGPFCASQPSRSGFGSEAPPSRNNATPASDDAPVMASVIHIASRERMEQDDA